MIESHNEIKECCILMLEDANFAIRCLGLIEKKNCNYDPKQQNSFVFSPFDNHSNLGCERCPGSPIVIQIKRMAIIEFVEGTKFWSYLELKMLHFLI